MEPFDTAGDSDIDEWTLISDVRPTCKPKPNPKPAPKYRFSLETPRAKWAGHAPQRGAIGLAAPVHPFQQLDSLHTSSHSRGLEAPVRKAMIPRSLQLQSLWMLLILWSLGGMQLVQSWSWGALLLLLDFQACLALRGWIQWFGRSSLASHQLFNSYGRPL